MFDTPDDVRAYWQTVVDGPGTINMNGSGDIPVKMIKADTVEELVEKLGLPKDETLKTVEAYNGYCDAGVDEEFGKRKELLLPIKKGPFYGIECTPWFLSTTGGIRCNDNLQVMNADDEVIEGPVLPGLHGGRHVQQLLLHALPWSQPGRHVPHLRLRDRP